MKRLFLIALAGAVPVSIALNATASPFLQKILPAPLFAPGESAQAAGMLQNLLLSERIEIGDLSIPTYELNRFYAARQYQPLWAEKGALTRKAEKLLAAIEPLAGNHALPVSRYPLAAIDHLADTATEPARRTVLLDLLVSHAAMRLAFDLHNGIAAPASSLTGKPGGAELLDRIAQGDDPAEAFGHLLPTLPEYAALQRLYVRLRAEPPAPITPLPSGPSIKPGMSDPRLPILRQLLLQQGELNEAQIMEGDRYDETAQEAVMRFQQRHGLNADGAVGGLTLAALNTPLSARIPQIAATMERLRWLPEQLPERYVLINLPAYSLRAFDEGRQALAMRVIVGTPKNRTPLFSNIINQVVFNPTWSVPKSIATKEMLGKIRENPDYLPQHNYRLLARGEGGLHEVDPWNVDWDSLGEDHFPYLIRQDAGDDNALGKVKFNLPDNGAIYLHDTASPKLFAKDARALSHGCIRLEHPRDMAHYILGPQWNAEKIEAYYDSDAPRTIPVAEPVPVYLVYWTALVGADGTASFYSDIYGKDAELAKKLGW